MTTTDVVWLVALDARDAGHCEDVELIQDDCGVLSLVLLTFADGSLMVVGPEDDGGYTWSRYSDREALALVQATQTDGSPDVATLAAVIRREGQR